MFCDVPSHSTLFNPKDLQLTHTTWHGGDVHQSSPQIRLRRQDLPDTHPEELEIPSSNVKRFKVSFTSDLYESSKEMSVVLAEYGTQLIGKEPFRIIFESTLPQNSTQEYVDKLIYTLKTYLQENLPTTSKRSVEVSLQKNKDGHISEATITISVNTENSQIKYLRVDLSKPNVNIRQAILTSLITTIKAPRRSGDDGKVLNVMVKPPFGADNFILQHITNTFRHVLTKLTKSSDISINTFPNENSDGSISKIAYNITIGSISRFSKHFNLDLSEQGSDFSEMLRNILPTLREQVITNLISGGTVTFGIEIQPPIYATNDLSESYHSIISSELQKVFPDYSFIIRIKLPDDLDQVNLGLISFIITIKPRDSIGDIDLLDSDENERFTEKVEKILTHLLIKINKEYPDGGTVFFNLQVQIPDEFDDISLDNTINQIRKSIIKAFDNEDRKINLKITEDFLGNIMNLKITLIIDPKTVHQSDEITVSLDISTSENNIEEKLKLSMSDATKQISQKLMENLPVHLKFVIQSSIGSDNVFVENIKSKIYLYVSKIYPNNEIKMEAIREEKGDVVDIIVLSTIRPISRVILTINLPPLENDLTEVMSRIILNISRELSNNHHKEEPFNIGLHIQISQNVTEQDIGNITDSIVNIIIKALPEYLVNVADGTILNFKDDIVHLYLLLSIKSQQQIYVLNLTSSGSEMIEAISQILLNATNQFVEYSTEGKSADFVLNIYPPNKSTDEFVKNAQDSIHALVLKLFPSDKITIRVKELKDSRDYVGLIKIFFSFQPKLIHSTTTSTTISSTIEPLSSTDDQITSTHVIENETENYVHSMEPLVLEDFSGTDRKNSITDPGLSKEFRDSIGIISRKDEPNIILHIADGSLPHEISDKIFNINLNSSGTIDSTELSKILEILQFDISDELKKDLEVDLKVNIQVPARITPNAIRKISQPLIPILRKFFPNNRITPYDTQKTDTRITLGVTIQPAAHIHINIDLLQTRDNFVDIIHQKISRVVSNRNFQNNVHNRLTATIVINIIPPKKKKKGYLQVISEALVLNLKEYFPKSKIYVKIFTEKDRHDYLTEIHILITVGPSDVKYIEKVIDIDFTKNNLNLDEYINEKLPDVIYHASIHLAEGLSINLNFNIKSYDKSTKMPSNWIMKKIAGIIKKIFLLIKLM
ncbi:hypothetical protein WA026_006391 [Henosepilachna vigintioctopunctata]|uniref:EF-hand domain-containing protein n=1 Tax=Henosepilachna vigintioctopunctata TaxID=420089 RepID=A0AAW1TQ98_9CUCU